MPFCLLSVADVLVFRVLTSLLNLSDQSPHISCMVPSSFCDDFGEKGFFPIFLHCNPHWHVVHSIAIIFFHKQFCSCETSQANHAIVLCTSVFVLIVKQTTYSFYIKIVLNFVPQSTPGLSWHLWFFSAHSVHNHIYFPSQIYLLQGFFFAP